MCEHIIRQAERRWICIIFFLVFNAKAGWCNCEICPLACFRCDWRVKLFAHLSLLINSYFITIRFLFVSLNKYNRILKSVRSRLVKTAFEGNYNIPVTVRILAKSRTCCSTLYARSRQSCTIRKHVFEQYGNLILIKRWRRTVDPNSRSGRIQFLIGWRANYTRGLC